MANPPPPPPPPPSIGRSSSPDPMAPADPEEPPKPPLSDPSGSDPDDPLRAPPPPPPPPAADGASATAPTAIALTAAVPLAEAIDSSDKKKKKKAEEGEGCRSCSCKKSKCLKLYCVCFASGAHCSESCGCDPCYNKPIHGVPRNIPVFPLKVVQTSETGLDSADPYLRFPSDITKRKCTCKKSGCLKKYCECYQGQAGCSINCKCDDCRNPFGKRVGVILDGRSNVVAPNERNGADFDSSDNEDDYYINRPLSPIPPSPISRESSFQQETLVGVEVQTMNGHLYPKPLSQVRPESWQLSRRPTEEVRVEPWRSLRRPSEDGTSDVMEGYGDPKFQRDTKRPRNHEDLFSISRCIEVMNTMGDLSQVEKSLAPDVFLEPNNREIFLSLSLDIRTMWLRRKIKSLV